MKQGTRKTEVRNWTDRQWGCKWQQKWRSRTRLRWRCRNKDTWARWQCWTCNLICNFEVCRQATTTLLSLCWWMPSANFPSSRIRSDVQTAEGESSSRCYFLRSV
jgi:hypothetical protein